jgi:hypothetical protein
VWKRDSWVSTCNGTVRRTGSGSPGLTFTAPNTPILKTRASARVCALREYQSPGVASAAACSATRHGATRAGVRSLTEMSPKRYRAP